jgi:hypothetical protein
VKRTPLRRRTPLRPRTWLATKAELRRGKATLARRTPLKARGGDRFPRLRDDKYRAFIREQPCHLWHGALCFIELPSVAAHVKSRGAGGPDRGNILPLCRAHHQEQHAIGIRSFEARYHVDLAQIAAEYATDYARDYPTFQGAA